MADMEEIPAGPQQLGGFALAFMELIEAAYGDEVTIGSVGIVAEVTYKVGSGEQTSITCWSSMDVPWMQAALFREAAKATDNDIG